MENNGEKISNGKNSKQRKMKNFLFILEDLTMRGTRFMAKTSIFRKLFLSRREEYRMLKGIFSFFYGFTLGFVFYEFILAELQINLTLIYFSGLLICLLIAIGCAVSSQVRCTSVLTLPSFLGKAGRASLKALVVTYLITGPISNLTLNGAEVMRTFLCTTSLTYNLTKAKYELMVKPFKSAISGVKIDTSEVKDTLESIEDMIEPIKNEFEEKTETKALKEENDYIDNLQNNSLRSEDISNSHNNEYEDVYFQKLEYRCDNIISAATGNCYKMFEKAYDSCYETVSWAAAWLLCWPMKITFICNIVGTMGGHQICDPKTVIPSGFGKGYNELRNSKKLLIENIDVGILQYKLQKPNYEIEAKGAVEAASAVVHEFDEKKGFIVHLITLLQTIMTFVFMKIIIDAQAYHTGYLMDIMYDNIYITEYFKKIDARRFKQNKHTLLPKKKRESDKLVDPHQCGLTSKEKSNMFSHIIIIITDMITATTIVIFDRMFYETLDLVRRHAKIEFKQTGYHDLTVKVKGTGMIASLIRSLIEGFNFNSQLNMLKSNEKCLPQPNVLSSKHLNQIYGTYVILLIIVMSEGYTQRLKRIICSYFYPKREKKRVLYLYNQSLKERINFYKRMKQKVKLLVKENRLKEDMNFCLHLKLTIPAFFGWLGFFESAQRKCLICGKLKTDFLNTEPEGRRKKSSEQSVICENCHYLYCKECWIDINKICYVCNPPDTDEEDFSAPDDDGENAPETI